MPKPFQQLGGWLKFFQVLYLGILIIILYETFYLVLGILRIGIPVGAFKYLALLLFYLLMNLSLLFFLYRKIEIPAAAAHRQLLKLHILALLGNILIYLLTTFYLGGFLNHLFELFFPAAFYTLGLFYLKQSKRVQVYFKLNPNQHDSDPA